MDGMQSIVPISRPFSPVAETVRHRSQCFDFSYAINCATHFDVAPPKLSFAACSLSRCARLAKNRACIKNGFREVDPMNTFHVMKILCRALIFCLWLIATWFCHAAVDQRHVVLITIDGFPARMFWDARTPIPHIRQLT